MSKNVAFVLRHSFVIRLPSRSLGESWCFVIRLFSIVVSELPKTATGKVQKYVLRGKPAISKQ
jgi:acyl-CoA synthetase (AMP-forming)/AMP-acid ligase II